MSDHRYGKAARRSGTHWDGMPLSPPCLWCGKRKRGAIFYQERVMCRRCTMREMSARGISCPPKSGWRWLSTQYGVHGVMSCR